MEFVEDEAEVRGEEYTLRGGQESYHRRISTRSWHNGGVNQAHAIAIVASHGVSRLLGWGGVGGQTQLRTANKRTVSLGARPDRARETHQGCVYLLGSFS